MACLLAVLVPGLHAAIVRITITGTVAEFNISEGPVFGYPSKQPLPRDLPFILTYAFDDQRGATTADSEPNGRLIMSRQSGSHAASPGVSAVLQVGDAVWEFGDSVRSEIRTTLKGREKILSMRYETGDKDNWIRSVLALEGTAAWSSSGDWRQSFYAPALLRQPSPFSIDNGTVSASGALMASAVRVSGIDLRAQALSFSLPETKPTGWPARKWRLTVPSPMGGYVVEKITQTVAGIVAATSGPVTPRSTTYWLAWEVMPGSVTTTPGQEAFVNAYPPSSTGTITIEASARFYEGLTLPPGFRVGAVGFAPDVLSSGSDPNPGTEHATLPITLSTTFSF